MTDNGDTIRLQNEALFQFLIAALRAEFGDDLLGILATGSRVHGTPGPTSDLDAHVLIAQPRRQRRNLVHDRVELELFINPPFQIRRYFADELSHDPHMFTFGQAIYDPQGVVATLQAEARAIWERGPKPIGENERWLHRYSVADLLRDIEDVAHDEVAVGMLIPAVVERLLETHARIHGRWLDKPKRRVEGLATWDRHTAALVRDCLRPDPLAQRIDATRRLAQAVLAPIGGLMPLQWQTEWEMLQP